MNSNFINYFLLYLHTKKIVSDYFWFWEFHEIFASTTLLGNYYHFLTFLHKWFSFSVKLLNYRYLQWTYLIFFFFFSYLLKEEGGGAGILSQIFIIWHRLPPPPPPPPDDDDFLFEGLLFRFRFLGLVGWGWTGAATADGSRFEIGELVAPILSYN